MSHSDLMKRDGWKGGGVVVLDLGLVGSVWCRMVEVVSLKDPTWPRGVQLSEFGSGGGKKELK